MTRVLKTLTGKRAIISTRGLRRVVLKPSGRIIGELVPIDEAKAMVDACNGCRTKVRAVAQQYK